MASESITHSAFGLIVNYTEMGQLRVLSQGFSDIENNIK